MFFLTVGHYLSSRWTDFLLEKGRRGNYAGRIVDEASQNSPGQEASVFSDKKTIKTDPQKYKKSSTKTQQAVTNAG